MSNRDYPVEDMGLFVTIDELNLEEIENEFFDPQYRLDIDDLTGEIAYGYLEMDEGGIQGCNSFGGEFCATDVVGLLDNSPKPHLDTDSNNWVLMQIPRYPNLFKAQYKNEEALIAEIKNLYSKYIRTNIDYKDRLVRLEGVYNG